MTRHKIPHDNAGPSLARLSHGIISHGDDGFTLLEVVVVVALIALIAIVALPSISSYFKVSLESAARSMAGTFKDGYNTAMLTGNVYRLAYDFKTAQYWVESGPANALLDTEESKKKADSSPSLREVGG